MERRRRAMDPKRWETLSAAVHVGGIGIVVGATWSSMTGTADAVTIPVSVLGVLVVAPLAIVCIAAVSTRFFDTE